VIVPSNITLDPPIIIDAPWDGEYDFSNNDGSPYDFTGWDVEASLFSAGSTNSVSFSVDVVGGAVTLSLTQAQTAALIDRMRTTYSIWMIGAVGGAHVGQGPYYLVTGDVGFQSVT
jgi:hypothetical protein